MADTYQQHSGKIVRVGVGRIVLEFHNNPDLKGKSRMITEVCEGLRKKFNISALEVDSFDDPEKCVIGFAAVIPATWRHSAAEALVEKICKTIDSTAEARVTVEDTEIMEYGEGSFVQD